MKAFDDGFNWHIGGGKQAKIRLDNWGFKGLDGDLLFEPNIESREMIVHKLWIPNRCAWDEARVRAFIGPMLVRLLLLYLW